MKVAVVDSNLTDWNSTSVNILRFGPRILSLPKSILTYLSHLPERVNWASLTVVLFFADVADRQIHAII